MTNLSGRDYMDIPQLVADALRYIQVPRTYEMGSSPKVVSSLQGTTITYITNRITYEEELIGALPAVVVDINPLVAMKYLYEGTQLRRLIPLVLLVFTPLTAYLDDVIDQDDRNTRIRLADEDIKTMVGDIESVLNTEEARRRIGKYLDVTKAMIPYEEVEFQANTHVRARVAEIWIEVATPVRGH